MTDKFKTACANAILLIFTIVLCVFAVEVTYRKVIEKNNYTYSKGMFVTDKDLGYKLATNYKGTAKREEFNNEIITNSLGFRDVEHSIEKQPGTTRVLAVGDSFTMGYSVKMKEVYTRLLEKKLNEAGGDESANSESSSGKKFEIVNAGVAGFDTPQEVAYLKRDGLKLNPDIIVLAWYYNDFMGVPVGPEPYVMDGYLITPPKDPDAFQTKIFRTLRSWKFAKEIILGKLQRFGVKKIAVDKNSFDIDSVRINHKSPDSEAKITLATQYLDDFFTILKERNIKGVLMLIPADFHVVPAKKDTLLKQFGAQMEDMDFARPYKEIENYFKAQGVPVLNLYSYIADYQNPDEIYFEKDGHFSTKGNEFVAGYLANLINLL